MERSQFLGAVAAGAALSAAGASSALAADPQSFQTISNRNIVFMSKIIQAVIDDLNQDAADYGGFRVKAIRDLQAANNDLQQALQHINP